MARVLGLVTIVVCIVSALSLPANAASPIQITKINYNPTGSDTRSNSQLVREYVVIKNTGSTSRSLKGWTLRDLKDHVYTFGAFTLAPGARVIVHTGQGSNSSGHRYMGRGWYIWNNTGDEKGTLKNASGTTADTCAYRGDGGDGDYKNC